jgi:hypothetical protein
MSTSYKLAEYVALPSITKEEGALLTSLLGVPYYDDFQEGSEEVLHLWFGMSDNLKVLHANYRRLIPSDPTVIGTLVELVQLFSNFTNDCIPTTAHYMEASALLTRSKP